jgi:IS5 family transposase
MFKVLVLQTLYTLSDDQTEYQLKDRLSFMRFIGLALHEPVPDAKTIWLYREHLARAGATERLFARFDALLRAKGWLAMGGQIIDATVIEARRPRLTQTEKATLKGGGTPTEWKPARRAQIDHDGRWTIKRGKKRETAPGERYQRQVEIAVPVFGYKNHIGIDREHGFLGRYTVTHAAAYDGGQLGASARSQQHRQRGVGRHRLSLGGQSHLARAPRPQSTIPAQKAPRQENAGAYRPRQCHPRARCAHASSMSLPPRNAASGSLSAPSA